MGAADVLGVSAAAKWCQHQFSALPTGRYCQQQPPVNTEASMSLRRGVHMCLVAAACKQDSVRLLPFQVRYCNGPRTSCAMRMPPAHRILQSTTTPLAHQHQQHAADVSCSIEKQPAIADAVHALDRLAPAAHPRTGTVLARMMHIMRQTETHAPALCATVQPLQSSCWCISTKSYRQSRLFDDHAHSPTIPAKSQPCSHTLGQQCFAVSVLQQHEPTPTAGHVGAPLIDLQLERETADPHIIKSKWLCSAGCCWWQPEFGGKLAIYVISMVHYTRT